jgi:MGT family glycosyltransferase
MARCLVYTSPSRGHLYPTVPTLKELRRRGHEVSIRTLAGELEPLRSLGFAAQAVSPAIEALEDDDWRARTPIGAQRREVRVFVARARHELPQLRRAIEGERPDLLFIDVTAWGAAVAAEASGLPWAMFGHFPLPIASREAPPYGLGVPPRSDALGRVRDALLRRLVLGPLERLVIPPLNDLRKPLGLRPLRDAHDFFTGTAPLLVYYTAEPFEYPRGDWPPSVRLVGPGVWEPPQEPPPWLADVRRPLVLVTCSTDFQDDAVLIEAVLRALAGEDVEVVATAAAVDPSSFQVPANARVERYLPHGALLERAAAVICHGGMGITQKALAAGVPVCVVPFGRDQPEVAQRVVTAAAGVRLSRSRLKRPEAVRGALRETLALRAGAQRIAAAFAAAGGAHAAANSREDLIEQAAGTSRHAVHRLAASRG